MKLLFIFSLIIFNLASAADLEITNAVIRLVPPVVKTTAAFMRIKNTSNKPITILKVTSKLSDQIEMHEMIMEKNMMQMRPMPSIIIEAQKSVDLKPGGKHLMFFNLKNDLKEGQFHNLIFELSDKSRIDINAQVLKID